MSEAITYRDALGRALREALHADPAVVVLGQDVGARGGAYGVTAGLLEAFGPERVRDAPSAEAALVGVGVGAALAGLRPVVELPTAAYLPLAFDQLVHHAAPLRALSGGQLSVPLTLRVPQTGGGRLGPIHTANVEALLHHIPGLAVVAPSTPADAHGLLAAAIATDDPVVVLEHTALYDTRGALGTGDVALDRAAVRRAGGDVTLVAASRMAAVAERAAATLAAEHGVEATLVDLRSLRPLDVETVRTAIRGTADRVVVVEEGWPHGGIGATLTALLGQPVTRVTGADAFSGYAPALEAAALPDEAAIVRAALARSGFRRPGGSAPAHTLSAEIDMEALLAARRARGVALGPLVAATVGDLLELIDDAAIVTDDGTVTVLGARADAAARPPAVTLTLGATVTRPTVVDGAVTVRHLAPLTVRVAPGRATPEDAATLLASLRARLAEPT